MKARTDYQYKNWAETCHCSPELYFEPCNVVEVKQILMEATANNKKIKVVGSGISPSDIACTNDYMVSMKKFNRVVTVDQNKRQVTVEAGLLVSELNKDILPKYGLALSVLGSVSWQSVGGFIGTGSHGTGSKFGSISSYVVAIKLIDSGGTIINCSKHDNPEIFYAAQCHLGILGIVLEVTLQCEPAFYLEEKQAPEKFTDVLSALEEHILSCEHFRFMWFPYTGMVTTCKSNRTKKSLQDDPPSWFSSTLIGYHLLQFLLWICTFFPFLLSPLTKLWFNIFFGDKKQRVGASYEVFNFNCLFKQYTSEWAVPRKHTVQVLNKMKSFFDSNTHIKVHFPIEVRFVKKDDVMMTPSGDEEMTYIGIVSYRIYGKDVEHDALWDFFQDLVMSYGGKPHWAKTHKANEVYLRKVYQNFDRFMNIRKKLDPTGMFINPYWERIFSCNNS